MKQQAIDNIIRRQLAEFHAAMPDNKQGHEFTFEGKTYAAAIRRLTSSECDKMQGIHLNNKI